MRAVTFHGKEDFRVDKVPDPSIQQPTDAIVRITSTAICGSDLHLYGVLTMFMEEGDIVGHEPMGIVEEVGSEVTQIKPGDRVVVPFNIACGHCWMCNHGLMAQCETTQVKAHRQRRRVVRLHQVVRAGAWLAGRIPARAAGAVRPDQGAGRPERRALPVPVRRAADFVAGGRIRQRARRRHAGGVRTRADRTDVLPHRAGTRRGTRLRHRPRARTPADGGASRRRNHRHQPGRQRAGIHP